MDTERAVGHDSGVADDDIEKLLREIAAMDAQGASPSKGVEPVASSRDVQPATESRSPRVRWALIAAVGSGGAGFIVGSLLWMLPWVNGLSTGIGAALGGALAGLVGGPPGWMRR